MLKTKRGRPTYQRGQYRLDWDRSPTGELRSPFLAVFWYDGTARRGRSASTGTADVDEGKTWLDAFFLERTSGEAYCRTCGQAVRTAGRFLVTDAIQSYLLLHAAAQASSKAISARLAHVLNYLTTLRASDVACDDVDELWIRRFRTWLEAKPIINPKGGERRRSLSTVEGSVAQLAAAVNFSWRRGDTPNPARFKSAPPRSTNNSPQHRSDVREVAAMIRYCIDPDVSRELANGWGRRRAGYSEAELIATRRRERAALYRYIILGIASWARPDALHDFSTAPQRQQWNRQRGVARLNPAGRRQTKKYRATVPIAGRIAALINAAPVGYFVGPKSVDKAWNRMASELGLPKNQRGEAGLKLIRRSMAHIARQRLPQEAWGEVTMFMGHSGFDSITDIYAPFDPGYLSRALSVVEAVCDEIESIIPGAFRRTLAGLADDTVPLAGGKK